MNRFSLKLTLTGLNKVSYKASSEEYDNDLDSQGELLKDLARDIAHARTED